MNSPPIGVVRPRVKTRYAAALFALLGALPSACVYDSADRCGPHQVMYEDLRCVCDATSAPTATGCEPCAENEVPGVMGCECKPGYTKPAGGVCEIVIECAAPEDCPEGYVCDLKVTPGVCRKPPTGLGMSCMSSADCAGTEATYCDTFVTHSCLVEGCSLAPDNCFTGFECCDLSAFQIAKPLCVAEGQCMQ